MANPYGRKGRPQGDTPANMSAEEQLKVVQKQLLTLENEKHELAEKLQEALINQATIAAGGSVAILPDCDAEGLAISADAQVSSPARSDQADFGPVWLVRVYSDKAPGGVKIPCVVQVGRKAPNGKPAIFRRKFYTDTEIELPEWAIKTLEYPEEREFFEEVGSTVYEAAMRGDMGPANEAAHKMGFEKVYWQGEQLKYVAYINHYTVSRVAKKQGNLFLPAN